MRLASGAEMRVTGPTERAAVVCVDGGQGGEVEGTWSASVEWLVRRLAPRFPELAFSEVKYRIKSWKRLDWCVEDARAAIRETGAPRTVLLGFSMGGAVAIRAAEQEVGDAAERRARTFSWDRSAAAYLRVLEEVAGRQNGHGVTARSSTAHEPETTRR
jgi:hypothetical protein